ncbi:ABC transporter substrate-binding protein [Streptomyces sp. S1D4-11]
MSVGLDDVSSFTYRVYAATRPADATLAAPIVAHLVRTARARGTVLVDDAAEGGFSWEICTRVSEAMRAYGHTTTRRTLAAENDAADDFRTLAEKLTESGADAVVFAGGYARAAKLARALRSAGYRGTRLATQRALDPRFLTSAGDAAEGWIFSTAFLDPTRVTAARSFVTAYRERFGGAAPPWYSAEAYDATLFVARVMTTGAPPARNGARWWTGCATPTTGGSPNDCGTRHRAPATTWTGCISSRPPVAVSAISASTRTSRPEPRRPYLSQAVL